LDIPYNRQTPALQTLIKSDFRFPLSKLHLQIMKIALYGRLYDNKLTDFIKQLIAIIKSNNNNELYIYTPFFDFLTQKLNLNLNLPVINSCDDLKNNKIDVLFSIGGDGTLLNTITLIRDSGIPVLGINAGRLGFLSSISRDEFIPALKSIIDGKYITDKRTLIKLQTSQNLFGSDNFALNEMAVLKHDSPSMLNISAYINDLFLNSYWADGLLIATPTGSTGYSLSCGGPIIAPDSKNFVITPIASHNLTVRPIVIPDDCTIKLKIKPSLSQKTELRVSLDSRHEICDESCELIVSKQNFPVNLLRIPDSSFFSTIRNKLMWGLDIRN
jgi:NAD+ kinase